MRIEFEAYDGDNLVHELPGIQLPCNQTKYDEEDEKDTRPASETMMTEDREDEYIHVIEADVNDPEWRRQFNAWIYQVMNEALLVSGDDDYFDYYPGNLDALKGIVSKLKKRDWLRKSAKKALQYAYDVRYYDLEPETIIPVDEVPEYEKRRDKALSEAAEIFRMTYWNWQVKNR